MVNLSSFSCSIQWTLQHCALFLSTDIATVNSFPTNVYLCVYECKLYVFFLREVVNMRNSECHVLITLFGVPFCTLILDLSIGRQPLFLMLAQVSRESRTSKSLQGQHCLQMSTGYCRLTEWSNTVWKIVENTVIWWVFALQFFAIW